MSSKNATFEMGNGERVLIPEGFESFSCTLRELYQAISQGSEEVVIPLRRIQNTDPASIQSSLETIFEFYDQLKINDRFVYDNGCRDKEKGKVVKKQSTAEDAIFADSFVRKPDPIEIEDWVKNCFAPLSRDHFINAANTADYLNCTLFIEYCLDYMQYELQSDDKQQKIAFANYLNEPINPAHAEDQSDEDIFNVSAWAELDAKKKKIDQQKKE